MLIVSPLSLHLICLRQCLSVSPELTDGGDWLASWPWGSKRFPSLSLWSSRVADVHHCVQHLKGSWDLNSGPCAAGTLLSETHWVLKNWCDLSVGCTLTACHVACGSCFINKNGEWYRREVRGGKGSSEINTLVSKTITETPINLHNFKALCHFSFTVL